MLSLFGKRSQAPAPAAHFDEPVETGGLVYAVGDIHGCDHLARSLIARIIEDIDAQGAPAMIVFMGTMIGGVATALLLPIFSMGKMMAGG